GAPHFLELSPPHIGGGRGHGIDEAAGLVLRRPGASLLLGGGGELVRRIHDDQRIDSEKEIADQAEHRCTDPASGKAHAPHAAPVPNPPVTITLAPAHGLSSL